MVLRLRSADSQHKRGLTFPIYNWLLPIFLPSGSTACGGVNTRTQLMPRTCLCQPAGSLPPWGPSAHTPGQVRFAAEMPRVWPTADARPSGQELKQAAVTMPDWGLLRTFSLFFHISLSYFDLETLVSNQIHSFLKTAESGRTPQAV